MTALRILTLLMPMLASSQAFAISLGGTIHGKEAFLFTSGIAVFTLSLFAIFFVLALRQKRS